MLGLTGELEQRPPEKLRLPREPDRAQCLSLHVRPPRAREAAQIPTGSWKARRKELRKGYSFPALMQDCPGHGPDLHILYPKPVSEGRAPWGGWLTWSAGLTALQDT